MKQFQKITLRTVPGRGYSLTPIELVEILPFAPKRVYYLTSFESGAATGQHCHKVEEEFFIQVRGMSTAVIDRGQGGEEVRLTGPSEAIYVPNLVWHGFRDVSYDAVILALSSTHYDPSRSDYVEDYEEFKRISPYFAKKKEDDLPL